MIPDVLSRFGPHAADVSSFLRVAGPAAAELALTGGETLCVLLAHHCSSEEPWNLEARKVVHRRRVEIAAFLGLPKKPWVVKLLSRIRFADLDLPGDLNSLRRALRHRQARKWLRHLPDVHPGVFRLLADPRRRRTATYALLRSFAAPHADADYWLHLIDDVVGLMELLHPGRPIPRLRDGASLTELHGTLLHDEGAWDAVRARYVHFPAPPIPGNTEIQPIRSVEELNREGREVGHCIGSQYASMAHGESYAYRILYPERATVLLTRHQGRWWVQEARGLQDKSVSRTTAMAIHAWLSQARLESDRRPGSATESIALGSLNTILDHLQDITEFEPHVAETASEQEPLPEPDLIEAGISDCRSRLPLFSIRETLQETFRNLEARGQDPMMSDTASSSFISLVYEYGLPALDSAPPRSATAGTLIVVDGYPRELVRHYGQHAALPIALAGHPVLLVDPYARVSEQIQALLGLWSGVPLRRLWSGTLSGSHWRLLTEAASVIDQLPMEVCHLEEGGIAKLEAVTREWVDSLGSREPSEASDASSAAPCPTVLVTSADPILDVLGLEHADPTDARRTTRALTRRLTALARATNVRIVLCVERPLDSVLPNPAAPVDLRLTLRLDPQQTFDFAHWDLRQASATAWTSDYPTTAPVPICWNPDTGLLFEPRVG